MERPDSPCSSSEENCPCGVDERYPNWDDSKTFIKTQSPTDIYFNRPEEFSFIIDEEKSKRNIEYIKDAVIFTLNTMPKSIQVEFHLSRLGALKKPLNMFNYNRQHDDYTLTDEAVYYFNELLYEKPFRHSYNNIVSNLKEVNKIHQDANYYNRLMSYLTENQHFNDFEITNQQDRTKFLNVIGAHNANNALYHKNGEYSFDIDFEENINTRLSKLPYDNVKSLYSATKLEHHDLTRFINHIVDECSDYNKSIVDIVRNLLVSVGPGEFVTDGVINKKALIAINKHLNYNPYIVYPTQKNPMKYNSLYTILYIGERELNELIDMIINDFGITAEAESLRAAIFNYKQTLANSKAVSLYYLKKNVTVINNDAIKVINEILKSHPYRYERSLVTSIQDKHYVARYNISGIWDSFAKGLYLHIDKYYKFKPEAFSGSKTQTEYYAHTKFINTFKLYAPI